MKLSIIVPAYDEQATIRPILARVARARVAHQGLELEKEIIVVDDCSTDGTGAVLDELAAQGHIRLLRHPRNRGKGAAIRTGLQAATGDIIVIQDADLEYSPEDYPTLTKPILDGMADAVYGSRFLGTHRAFLFWHYVGNKLLTLLTNVLYNTILTDMETGAKAFRAEAIKGVRITCERFDFEPEITAKVLKRGYRLFEVPITYAGRNPSEGKKITWKDAFPAIWALIKFRFID
jgi:glycosyltransferase involved in cell wall biosynthesis